MNPVLPRFSFGDRPRAWAAGMIGLSVCLTAATLYFFVGRPAAPPPGAIGQGQGEAATYAKPLSLPAMVDRLVERLAKDPDNGESWLMLARSQAALGRFADAAEAFKRAERLLPANANIYADHADVLAMAQKGDFRGAPQRLIRQALELEPNHAKALALAGTADYRRDDLSAALRHWHKALAAAPADSDLATAIRNSIAEAEERLAKTPAAQAPQH